MQLSRMLLRLAGGSAFAAVLLLGNAATTAGEEHKSERAGKPIEVIASVWEIPRGSGELVLAAFNQSNPVKTVVTDDSRLEGTCVHCEIPLKCRAGELSKRCAVCPCERSNFQCLAGTALGDKPGETRWQELLRTLPIGTRLRLEYIDAEKPQSGIKRATIDRHGALLPVEGLGGATEQQLQALGKSVGAARAEPNSEGTRLQLSLKDNWTAGKQSRLEKALANIGAKLAALPAKSNPLER